MPKVLFLESITGTETLFIRGLRRGAEQAGWVTSVLFLRDQKEKAFPAEKIQSTIQKEGVDLICFLMDAPLPWENLWKTDFLREVPKISVWFDDFFRSPHTLKHPERWTRWQTECNTRVYIWDGYWREQWEKLTGVEAKPIHLAADDRQFDPNAAPFFPELKEHIVFLGTIPSLVSLEQEMGALPSLIQKILRETLPCLEKDSWSIRPYERAEEILSQLSEKHRAAAGQWLQNFVNRTLLNHQLWRWGKRIARIRGLKAAAEAIPLAILSGHHTEVFAQEEELRTELPQNARIEFRDTTKVPFNQWSRLFRTGKCQLQITDPQSIQGGIPFRVFECIACCAPLISDARPELAELFPQLPLAFNESEFARKVVSFDPKEINFEEMHRNFLQNHTWQARWEQITAETLTLPKSPL